MRLLLNGRFLTRPMTGVDRTATELIRAFLRNAPKAMVDGFTCLTPDLPIVEPEKRPAFLLQRVTRTTTRLKGIAWEQLVLARIRPDDWLLNLCNTGPIWRKKQIVMIHDAQTFTQPNAYSRGFRTWYRFALPRLGKNAAMALTVSEFSKMELEKLRIVPKGKGLVVPNGSDHILYSATDKDMLKREGLTKGQYFLTIGSPALHKNLPMLIKAAKARAETAMPLVIAGAGPAHVFSQTAPTPMPGIHTTGRVSDAELRALYQGAIALALPSLTEGFGLPAAEAMACGCPVIATTHGAVPEICGDAAIYADPNDANAWTTALETLAHDKALQQKLSRNGVKRACQFTWDNAANHLIQHLKTLQ